MANLKKYETNLVPRSLLSGRSRRRKRLGNETMMRLMAPIPRIRTRLYLNKTVPLLNVIKMPSFPQVTLNSYSFENVAFHVLHERIPLYTFRTLSDWWDHRTSLNRWRTVDHYVRRCRGNARILESVDFIGRTSELARLFGILFFSVISRGSQVFVMFMIRAIECSKTKTKVITLANHNRRKQHKEPIRTLSKYV